MWKLLCKIGMHKFSVYHLIDVSYDLIYCLRCQPKPGNMGYFVARRLTK